MQNWSGTYTYQAQRIERPASIDELRGLVKSSPRVRGLGTRHCFSPIADTPGTLVSTERLTTIDPIDAVARTVTIDSGVTYGQLGPVLQAAGFAIPNLASLPHISVAGATATATHGSGEHNQSLAASVSAVTFVTPDGDLKTFRRGDADFDGTVVHLGRLGVVARLTLDLVPAFDIAQFVYDAVPMAGFVERANDIVGSAYSVSGFTDWQTDRFTQVWMKCLAGRPHFDLSTVGGRAADAARHPLDNRSGNVASEGAGAAACTQQLGVPGPWHERLPHFRLEFTPSSGEEIQSEFFVPRDALGPALQAVAKLGPVLGPVLQVSEVRFIAADRLWMSPFYDRPSVGLHFTWRKMPAEVLAVVPKIEAALAPFDARPHPGKVSTTAADAAWKYPKRAAFESLVSRLDPAGKFAPLDPAYG